MNSPLLLRRPTRKPFGAVNQIPPSGPAVMPPICAPNSGGSGKSVTVPSAASRPIAARPASGNQMLPSGPRTIMVGPGTARAAPAWATLRLLTPPVARATTSLSRSRSSVLGPPSQRVPSGDAAIAPPLMPLRATVYWPSVPIRPTTPWAVK